MSLRARFAVVTLNVIAPTLAFGHPGHGVESSQDWLHYLTEPAHYGLVGFALLLLTIGLRFLQKLAARAGNG